MFQRQSSQRGKKPTGPWWVWATFGVKLNPHIGNTDENTGVTTFYQAEVADHTTFVDGEVVTRPVNRTATIYDAAPASTCVIMACPSCGPIKVTICHVPPGDPTAAETMCIDEADAIDELNNGSYCGPCLEVEVEAIPTLSQWCVFLFFVVVLILGVVLVFNMRGLMVS
jgi:hypothetical protein